MPKPSPEKPKIEFEPDAWARFETLVKSAAKLGHVPHKAAPSQPKKPVKKRPTETGHNKSPKAT
jgi:hypothetical protein